VLACISVTFAQVVPCHWMNGAWVFWADTMFVLGRVRVTTLVFDPGALEPHLLLSLQMLCHASGVDFPTTIQFRLHLGLQNFIFIINDALLVLLYAKITQKFRSVVGMHRSPGDHILNRHDPGNPL
jgi:hypothetical protein